MLVLARTIDEVVHVGDVTVMVVAVDGKVVRLGITAPRDMKITRGELLVREESESDDA
jgi:carbon storage regulator CsrA